MLILLFTNRRYKIQQQTDVRTAEIVMTACHQEQQQQHSIMIERKYFEEIFLDIIHFVYL